MLDAATRRRIDTARDILVGKVPDPKSQVEQITIALIYKFMDDMDAEAEELGGERAFFAGEFAGYGWARLMRPGLGGHETLTLYADALARMAENPGIPPLFRAIFTNAYLPFRDPETLRAFLKVIDEFRYDHSERLGDAFEYLLSVLGAQGAAGQFRTPRHLIDFMVEVLDPKKDERVLDPACGTAGFLISSYRHIRTANTDAHGHDRLSPDDRARLAANFTGYDISPDMVRLSLVNMYLHGFVAPRIFEYDTLTSQDRWHEWADVILANPPFMSPKGGIRPHNRFAVNSKRSEVLFVAYIAEHLTPGGRAGVIVPEGVIFQSQRAYTQLRKQMVAEYLLAVVSLPAGVFQPYSGVKTSILILDKALARQTDHIAFFSVAHDGYDLGAQRRPIAANDLPQARAELADYLGRLRTAAPLADFRPTLGRVVEKARLAADGDYNLSGERYREGRPQRAKWPLVAVRDVCDAILSGGTPSTKNEAYWQGAIPWITSADIVDIKTARPRRYITEAAIQESATNLIAKGNVIVVTRVGLGKLFRNDFDVCISQDSQGLILKEGVSADYLVYVLKDKVEEFKTVSQGSTIQGVTKKQLADIHIPLPPLEVQREIVAEIEGYRRVMDGARAVIDNYRPHIPVDPAWPVVALGDAIKTVIPPIKILAGNFKNDGKYPVIDQSQKAIAGRTDDENALIDGCKGMVIFGDHTCTVKFIAEKFAQGADGIKIIMTEEKLNPKFLYYYLLSYPITPDGYKRHFGNLKETSIAVPPLATQQTIVAELEAEQALVAANRELVERMEGKIRAAVGRVWGEDSPPCRRRK